MKDLIKLDEDHWQARKNMMIKDNWRVWNKGN
jgi:hypothetical protein